MANPPATPAAESSVPAVATPPTSALAAFEEPAQGAAPGQPVSVAFLPLALAIFVIIAFVLAAWTFLVAAT
jgi:hypothetical protein